MKNILNIETNFKDEKIVLSKIKIANEYYNLAISKFENEKYAIAIVFLLKAEKMMSEITKNTENKNFEKLISIYSLLFSSYIKLNNSKMEKYILTALKISKENFSENHILNIYLRSKLTKLNFKEKVNDNYYIKGLEKEFFERKYIHLSVEDFYLKLKIAEFFYEKTGIMINLSNDYQKLKSETISIKDILVSNYFFYEYSYFFNIRDIYKAKKCLYKCLYLNNRFFKTYNNRNAKIYYFLGETYRLLNNDLSYIDNKVYQKIITKGTLEIEKNQINNKFVAYIFFNMAEILEEDEILISKLYYLKSKEVSLKFLPITMNIVLDNYISLGNVYYKLLSFSKANDYYKMALSFYIQNFGYEHSEVGVVLALIGKTYIKLHDYNAGSEYIKFAIKRFKNNRDKNSEYYKYLQGMLDSAKKYSNG